MRLRTLLPRLEGYSPRMDDPERLVTGARPAYEARWPAVAKSLPEISVMRRAAAHPRGELDEPVAEPGLPGGLHRGRCRVLLQEAHLPVAGVTPGRQLPMFTGRPRRGQVEQRQPVRVGILAEVVGGEFLLDGLLPGGEPVHRRIDLVGASRGNTEVGGEGGVLPPPRRGQLRTGPADPGDDQRQRQIPGAAGRAQQARQAERPSLRGDRGDMPVGQGPHDRRLRVRGHQLFPAQSGDDRLDHMIRQCGKVRDRFLVDFRALTPRPP